MPRSATAKRPQTAAAAKLFATPLYRSQGTLIYKGLPIADIEKSLVPVQDFDTLFKLVTSQANLETLNAHFIHQGLAQKERLALLNQTAIVQMKLLLADVGVQRLQGKQP